MRSRLLPILVGIMVLVAFALTGCGQMEEVQVPRDNQGETASGLRVSFVDVGKGDCILLQAGDESALIDTGYEETADDVVSYLRAQGVQHLSWVMITHYDKDHVGGLRAIGKEFSPDAVYLPGYEGADKQYDFVRKAVEDLGLPAQKTTRELSLTVGPAKLAVYPSHLTYVPDANGNEGNDNDLSLVTALSFGKDSYLFTGDLEEEGIEAFLELGLGQADVLKMPHHGQKSKATSNLLESVRPQIAVITDGEDDPADKKTLRLLEDVDADTYRTSEDGTVVITSDGSGSYEVTTGD